MTVSSCPSIFCISTEFPPVSSTKNRHCTMLKLWLCGVAAGDLILWEESASVFTRFYSVARYAFLDLSAASTKLSIIFLTPYGKKSTKWFIFAKNNNNLCTAFSEKYSSISHQDPKYTTPSSWPQITLPSTTPPTTYPSMNSGSKSSQSTNRQTQPTSNILLNPTPIFIKTNNRR